MQIFTTHISLHVLISLRTINIHSIVGDDELAVLANSDLFLLACIQNFQDVLIEGTLTGLTTMSLQKNLNVSQLLKVELALLSHGFILQFKFLKLRL